MSIGVKFRATTSQLIVGILIPEVVKALSQTATVTVSQMLPHFLRQRLRRYWKTACIRDVYFV
jgi:hypothetical protein